MNHDHCVACASWTGSFYYKNPNDDTFFRELDYQIENESFNREARDFFKKYTPTFYRMFSGE